MILDNEEYYNYIEKCIKQDPCEVFISSFGFYAGILHDGSDITEIGLEYKSRTRDILELINKKGAECKILIGIGQYSSCKGKFIPCVNCEKQYVKSLIRLSFHADKFTYANFKITHNLHAKCFICKSKKNIAKNRYIGASGGRNFTDSNWNDISFEISGGEAAKLYAHMHDIWDDSLDLNDDNIDLIFENQGISKRGRRAVIKDLI